MVSRTADSFRITDIKHYAGAEYHITMSSNDSFTAFEFIATENLKKAVMMQDGLGTEATCTVLNNVVTLTTASLVNQKITLWIYGVRA
jgi:hypothetical protein